MTVTARAVPPFVESMNFEAPAPASAAHGNTQILRLRHLARAINRIAKLVFTILLCAAACYAGPNFFGLGCVSGVVFKDTMEAAPRKIINVWSRGNWIRRGVTLGLMVIIYTITAASFPFFVGCYVGTRFLSPPQPETKTSQVTEGDLQLIIKTLADRIRQLPTEEVTVSD